MSDTNELGHITDIDGISVGHITDSENHTGVTTIIFSDSVPAGVDVRGGAPGTRETDLLSPLNLVETIDAIALCGGSAFGLDAASGVMRYLKEKGRGLETGYGKVPIVPAAVIFDLPVSGGKALPDHNWGYEASKASSENDKSRGNVGAGAGATVGKLYGLEYAVKSGLGSALVTGAGGLRVGAICVVNSLGDVIDPNTGKVIAGTLGLDKKKFADSRKIIHDISYPYAPPASSTIIALIAVGANLTKLDMNKIARMAHDGIARTIFPSHTMLDGDTVFCVSTGGLDFADITICGALAAKALELAIIDAVKSAEGISGFMAARDIKGN